MINQSIWWIYVDICGYLMTYKQVSQRNKERSNIPTRVTYVFVSFESLEHSIIEHQSRNNSRHDFHCDSANFHLIAFKWHLKTSIDHGKFGMVNGIKFGMIHGIINYQFIMSKSIWFHGKFGKLHRSKWLHPLHFGHMETTMAPDCPLKRGGANWDPLSGSMCSLPQT